MRACLLHSYAQELFIFDLKASQAKNLGAQANGMRRVDGHPCRLPERSSRTLLNFDNLQLVHGSTFPAISPIVGSCKYSAAGDKAIPSLPRSGLRPSRACSRGELELS